jgi:hypothetical protein
MTTAFTLSLLVPLGLIVLILLVVVVLAQHRDEPDPPGRRPYAAYVFFVTFLALFTVLFALFAFVSSLMHIAVSGDGSSNALQRRTFTYGNGTQSFSAQGNQIGQSGSSQDGSSVTGVLSDRGSDDAHIRGAVRAGIVGVVAGAVLLFHVGRGRALADELLLEGSPAVRVYHAYLYAACAFAVIVGVGGAVTVGYSLFRIIAPGVANTSGVGKRSAGVPDLVSGAVLTAGAAAIFLYHWRRSPGSFTRTRPGSPPPPPEPVPTPPPSAPPRRPRARRSTTGGSAGAG